MPAVQMLEPAAASEIRRFERSALYKQAASRFSQRIALATPVNAEVSSSQQVPPDQLEHYSTASY